MRDHVRALSRVNGAALLSAAASALVGIATARLLGPAGHGELTLIVTVATITTLVAGLGTGTALRLRTRTRPDPGDVGGFLALSAPVSLLAAVLSVLLVAVLASAPDAGTLTAAGGLSLALMLGRQAAELLQAYGRTSASILSAGVSAAAQVALLVGVHTLHTITTTTALACLAAGALTQTLFAVAVLARDLPSSTLRWASVGELVRQGWPAVGHSLGLLSIQRIDRVVVVAVVGPTAGGLYAVAATLAETTRIASQSAGQLLFVRVSTAGRITADARRIYRLAVATQVAALVAVGVSAPLLVRLLVGEEYLDSVPMVRGLLVAEALMSLVLLDSRLLLGLRRLRAVSWTTTAAAAANVVLLLALVGPWGVTGAVVAATLSYAGLWAALVLQRRRVDKGQDQEHATAGRAPAGRRPPDHDHHHDHHHPTAPAPGAAARTLPPDERMTPWTGTSR